MSLSLAENVIVVGVDNRPPMLDKTQYSSWASRMLLYIKGKENGKLLVDSIINRPFQYGTITEPGTLTTPAIVRARRYDELTDAEKLREACDIIATNIERESKLYDKFDMFTSAPGETIHSYYLRCEAPVANYSSVAHHQSYQTPNLHQPPQASFPPMDSGFVVPSFLPFDDLIVSLNKAMAFISTTFTSRYPPTNNQLRTSSNLRNQATIQDGRVTIQIVQERQTQGYASNGARSNTTATRVNKTEGTNTTSQAKKAMLAEALELGVVLDEEQMAFLADNGDTVTISQASQAISTPTAFQTDDLDAFDSDCDEAPSASTVLMAKLSSYDSNILSEELLVYVKDTCPSSSQQIEKLIAVTPINKNRKVRFADTRVISSTSASGSKPPRNTKKNRISQKTSTNKKNKIEDHLRSVKPSLNKMNRVSRLVCNANVKHSMLNADSELICSTCNEFMFDAIHDLCVLDYVNDVNVRVKSKSIKSKKKKVWKPRITSTIVVPPKKPLSSTVVKKTPPSSNHSGKVKDITNVGSGSKSKSVESKISNDSEPNKN
ncbi:hypothetical protein Tco_1404697 [Tanacetum coccineum]